MADSNAKHSTNTTGKKVSYTRNTPALLMSFASWFYSNSTRSYYSRPGLQLLIRIFHFAGLRSPTATCTAVTNDGHARLNSCECGWREVGRGPATPRSTGGFWTCGRKARGERERPIPPHPHSPLLSSAIFVSRALVSFGQRLKRGALVTLPSGCHKIYDIR